MSTDTRTKPPPAPLTAGEKRMTAKTWIDHACPDAKFREAIAAMPEDLKALAIEAFRNADRYERLKKAIVDSNMHATQEDAYRLGRKRTPQELREYVLAGFSECFATLLRMEGVDPAAALHLFSAPISPQPIAEALNRALNPKAAESD